MSFDTHSTALDCILKSAALRWLHGIDFRNSSKTQGISDREYWAWKTKDFANGTLQAGLAGFLDCHSLLDFSEIQIKSIVRETIAGTVRIQRKNGSFEEAFPYESSYAVTGLVLFYLVYAKLRYPHFFDAQSARDLDTLANKARAFLIRTPETHGVISNHVATTELALSLYEYLQNRELPPLNVFKHQSNEGWFMEYSGADPGYQTLLEHYFAATISSGLHLPKATSELIKSRSFTKHFMLPNGSYGGEVGSRGTSIFYPSSLLLMSSECELDWFFSRHMQFKGCVSPLTVDTGNFVPVFNSWALFRKDFSRSTKSKLPFESSVNFPEAGIYVRRTLSEVFILSLPNCAWRHQSKQGDSWRDLSVSNISYQDRQLVQGKVEILEDRLVEFTTASAAHPPQRLNTYLSAIALRLFSKIFYYSPALLRSFKRLLAKYVMKAPQAEKSPVKIRIELNDKININSSHADLRMARYGFPFHMASANTFDERSL